jgi:ADP-ribose pyrophosphatase YjhB (NUDIX family)
MSDAQPRVGSALIVQDEDNRILLGKRNKDPQRGRWVLPGGKIRPFESIAEAAARELEEETGLKVQVRGQFRVYEVINPPSEHRIVIYSYARAAGGVIRAADDISEVRFVPLQELDALPLTPLVRQVLMDANLIQGEKPELEVALGHTSSSLFPDLPVHQRLRPSHRSRAGSRPRRRRVIEMPGQSSLVFETALGE